jgi:hypothetical protein
MAKIRSCLRDEISTADVAVLLCMSENSILRAVKAGLLENAKNNAGQKLRGRFILGKVVPAYVQHLHGAISADPEEAKLRAAKLRKALADAETSELELQQLKNELHPTDVVMFVWSSRIDASRKRLLAIPNRLAPHLAGETDQQKIYRHIHDEIVMALEDVTGLKEKDFVKENRRFLKTHRSDDNGE